MRWARLRDYDGPEAWVRRVAMNLAADRARSLRRHARAILRLGPPPAVPSVSVETLALVQALGTLPVRHDLRERLQEAAAAAAREGRRPSAARLAERPVPLAPRRRPGAPRSPPPPAPAPT
jgi:DNA-directed RNA polymerase specialized sigma24 family protein